jgi:hypothetical protein
MERFLGRIDFRQTFDFSKNSSVASRQAHSEQGKPQDAARRTLLLDTTPCPLETLSYHFYTEHNSLKALHQKI